MTAMIHATTDNIRGTVIETFRHFRCDHNHVMPSGNLVVDRFSVDRPDTEKAEIFRCDIAHLERLHMGRIDRVAIHRLDFPPGIAVRIGTRIESDTNILHFRVLTDLSHQPRQIFRIGRMIERIRHVARRLCIQIA